MPNHSNEQIKKQIDSSDELIKKMGLLRTSMVADLNKGFKELMGEDVPSMRHTKIRQTDTVMEYTSAIKIDHFLKAVLELGTAAFTGDEAVIVTKAMAVAGVALESIFGSVGLSTEIKGSSAILEHDDKEYLTAMYAVTQICTAKQWFTDSDFVLSSYVYFVTTPLAKETDSNVVDVTAVGRRPYGASFIRPEIRL